MTVVVAIVLLLVALRVFRDVAWIDDAPTGRTALAPSPAPAAAPVSAALPASPASPARGRSTATGVAVVVGR